MTPVTIPYENMSKADLIEVCQTQQATIQRFYKTIAISNSKASLGEKTAWLIAKPLLAQQTPNEQGLIRFPVDDVAQAMGMSGSSVSRYVTQPCERFGLTHESVPYTTKAGQKCNLTFIDPEEEYWIDLESAPLPEDAERKINGNGTCRCGGTIKKTRRILTYQEIHECDRCGEKTVFPVKETNHTPLPEGFHAGNEGLQAGDLLAKPENMQSLPVDTVSLVDELKNLPIWCCHRAKVPYNVSKDVRMYQKAEPDNKSTWTTFDQAQAIYETSRSWSKPFDGIGFMNTGDYVFTDIDHCRDVDTGEITEDAQALIACLDSYTEASYSGTGIHIIARGSIPRGRKHDGVEMYPARRFFTFTGQHIAGTPPTISESQAELDSLYQELFPADVPTPIVTPALHSPSSLPLDRILDKAKNDAKLVKLYGGDYSDYPGKDGKPDHSRGDQALFEKLLYWTDGDVSTSRKLFEDSQLMRDKWKNRTDYRASTINKALAMYQRSRQIAS